MEVGSVFLTEPAGASERLCSSRLAAVDRAPVSSRYSLICGIRSIVRLLRTSAHRNPRSQWVLHGLVGRDLTRGAQVDHSRTCNLSSVSPSSSHNTAGGLMNLFHRSPQRWSHSGPRTHQMKTDHDGHDSHHSHPHPNTAPTTSVTCSVVDSLFSRVLTTLDGVRPRRVLLCDQPNRHPDPDLLYLSLTRPSAQPLSLPRITSLPRTSHSYVGVTSSKCS
jgi:hypothetical protein